MNYHDLEAESLAEGNHIEVVGLEIQARVLAERVANFITMRSRNLLDKVRLEADMDGLTGCFTRRCLDRRLQIEFGNPNDWPLTVAFLDLDHFGAVNKDHGWQTGDKLLLEVCDAIRDQLRNSDWLGRYGGEEFCLVMPNTTLDEARQILSRLRETIEQTEFTSVKQQSVPMTVSIGAAMARPDETSYTELLARASDQALKAKRTGRNQICISAAAAS